MEEEGECCRDAIVTLKTVWALYENNESRF